MLASPHIHFSLTGAPLSKCTEASASVSQRTASLRVLNVKEEPGSSSALRSERRSLTGRTWLPTTRTSSRNLTKTSAGEPFCHRRGLPLANARVR